MSEFTITHKDTKHHCTLLTDSLFEDEYEVSITRHRLNGGQPITIYAKIEKDATFREVLKKLNNIAKLEDDIYDMVAEHSNNPMN